MESQPNEIIKYILSYLDNRELNLARRVNHRWKQLIENMFGLDIPPLHVCILTKNYYHFGKHYLNYCYDDRVTSITDANIFITDKHYYYNLSILIGDKYLKISPPVCNPIDLTQECMLIYAIQKGHLEVIKFLVEIGVDICIYSRDTIRESIKHNHFEINKYLIDAHIKKDSNEIQQIYDACLQLCIKYHHLHFENRVKYFIELGANIHSWDDRGLIECAGTGNLEMVKYLISHGMDINVDTGIDESCLSKSCKKGHIDIVKYLVESGADIHFSDDRALFCGAYCGHYEIVKYLIECGANIHGYDNCILGGACASGNLELIKYLINQGADTNANALRYSIEQNHLEIVKYFLEHNANIHANDDDALRISCKKGHFEMVKLLIKSGANINAKNDDALLQCIEHDHIRIAKYLLKRGAVVREYMLKNKHSNIYNIHSILKKN